MTNSLSAVPNTPERRPVRTLAVIVTLTLALLATPLLTEPVDGFGHAAVTFRGRVTVDGAAAPAGTPISLTTIFGDPIGAGRTGANDLPGDEYSIVVPDVNAPPENSIVTVTAEGFVETESVDVRYVFFGGTVTADIAAFTARRMELPDPAEGQALIPLPQFVNLSPEATGEDANGNPVQVIGGTIRMDAVGEMVNVPVVLFGSTLESLDDPVSGITIRRIDGQMLIRIPFRDENGDDTIRVLVDVQHLSGKGFTASGVITGLRVDAPTRSRDFSAFDERVGTGSVKVLGIINTYPGESLLNMNLLPDPDPVDTDRLREALAGRGQETADIAFAVKFLIWRLDSVQWIATLRLTVGKDWFDAQETGSVIVVRLADDGTEQFFSFVPLDVNADPVRFDLESPEGLSAFVIIAVREAAEATVTPTPNPTATPEPTVTPTPTVSLPVTPTTAPATTATTMPVATPPASTATTPIQPTATSAVITSTPIAGPEPTATTVLTSAPTGSGSCNSPADGRVSAGHLALLLSPLALVALRTRQSR